MRYKSTDWSIEVPQGWAFEEEEFCTTFISRHRDAAIQISGYRKEEAVTDEDLKEFADETHLSPVSFSRLAGYRARFSEDDTFWTMWWLRSGCRMIYVTYNCPLAALNPEKEGEISSMMESLELE